MKDISTKTELILLACFIIAATSAVYVTRVDKVPVSAFNIAVHLCEKNEGVKAVSRNIAISEWNIYCNNSAEFRAVVINVNENTKKGEALGTAKATN